MLKNCVKNWKVLEDIQGVKLLKKVQGMVPRNLTIVTELGDIWKDGWTKQRE